MKKVIENIYSAMYKRNNDIAFVEMLLVTITTICVLLVAIVFTAFTII